MNKQYREVRDFINSYVKKTKVVILGVCFLLTPLATEAAIDNQEQSFKNVEAAEDSVPVSTSYQSVNFELSENQDNWNAMLEDLAEYPDDWDGEGARAISKATVENCRVVLRDAADYVALLDDIFPTAFGSVCIQWYNPTSDALINAEIAPDRMAFYAHEPGKDLFDFKPSPFGKDSIDVLVSILKDLS